MSRALSVTGYESLFEEETDEAWLILLTIDHEDFEEPIRVVANTENVVSNGNLFVAYPFELTLPTSSGETLATTKVRVSNVDRTIVQTIRSTESAPSALIQICLASDPDVIEADFEGLQMAKTEYDALTVEGEFSYQNSFASGFPAHRYTPRNCPALF